MPITSAAAVSRSASSSRAMPKSLSFTSPVVEIRMLAGLMSRCTRPKLCTAASAPATAAPTRATSAGGIPVGVIRLASVPPWTSSITR